MTAQYQKNKSMVIRQIVILSSFIVTTCIIPTVYADEKTNIMRQDLATALIKLAQQRSISIIYNSKLLKGKKSPKVNGYFSTKKTLQKLLMGSGYTFEADRKGNFYIRKKSIKTVASIKTSNDDIDKFNDNTALNIEEEIFEDIVSTGSHIIGVGAVGSQILIFNREKIDQHGYATLTQFIQGLSLNFNGGVSETTSQLSFENDAANNQNNGVGINLRGLGNTSTLVLLNGQRLAPSGINGGYVDISMIPLSAIEQVEVLPDSASAIYGSDAIGGVVNFKLRKNYNGAETRVRYGLATEGGLEEIVIGQTLGKAWERGQGFISYEYYHRNALDAKDRSFTKDAPAPNDLLPEQGRHNIFLSGGYYLNENLEILTTAHYNDRSSKQNQFLTLSSPPDFNESKTKQYGGTLGALLDLENNFGSDWRSEISGSYSHSEYIYKTRIQNEPESTSRIVNRFSENVSVNLNLTGSLLSLASGDIKLATGIHFRRDSFGDMDLPVDQSLIRLPINDFSHNIIALYGELYLPIVGLQNRITGIEQLEISISGRTERYSDFGSSTNPKISFLYSPTSGINIRGTYSTSFRAPLLNELDETANFALLLNNIPNDMSDTGTSLVIQLAGPGNANLKPEKATTWTLGFDLQPIAVPNLKVSATYFNINYKDRIDFSRFEIFSLLTDPNATPFADFNGPDADLFALIENYQMLNFTFFPGFGPPADFQDADVVFDGRQQNLSRNKVTGFDFAFSYGFDTEDTGRWDFSLGGTYLLNFLKQTEKETPVIDFIGTIDNPVSLQFHSNISWIYEGFTTNLLINYIDDYVDSRTAINVPVSSWTTANLNINYHTTGRFGGWLDDLVFSISAVNILNTAPPFLSSLRANTNINYDPNNANPAGRTLSFQITKQW